jgi:hypothetical protein
VDADVLIAAAKGTEDFSVAALAVLDDPDRSFVASDLVKLEVLPMPTFFGHARTVSFYEEYFDERRSGAGVPKSR